MFICISSGSTLDNAVRWNVKVAKETDPALRTFLGARGMKKGDLSKFIEEAVRAQVFHRKVEEIKRKNASSDPDPLQSLIDQAVREVTRLYTKNRAC